MNWISVQNNLPEVNDLVLAWNEANQEYVLAQYDKWGQWEWQAFNNYCTGLTKTEITHWQELPERPIVEMPKVSEIKTGELIGDRLE